MWVLETARMTDNKKTVLIVDDEPSSREVLKTALEAWGYTAEVAEDGLEALTAYERHLPDLVLSDVVMPNLDGLGFLRALKQKYPDSIVILFTAYASLSATGAETQFCSLAGVSGVFPSFRFWLPPAGT
jgi:CheY-like chemotaxis protein